MNKIYILLISFSIGVLSCTNNETKKTYGNLYKSEIPDLSYFNSNKKIENDTLFLTIGNDTIKEFIYDSIGRLCIYKYNKVFSRMEHYIYFEKTHFMMAKYINVDYSMIYNSSLVQISEDTLLSYWYEGFGDIQDTFRYVFNNNKVVSLTSSPLNDYQRLKTKKTFFYADSLLKKIIALPIKGELSHYGKIDSIVTCYNYSDNLVSQITEKFFLKDRKYNYKNEIFFDKKGFPNKYVERDTIEYKISH